MRIKDMINKSGNCFFHKKMYGLPVRRFCILALGFKGLTVSWREEVNFYRQTGMFGPNTIGMSELDL